VQVQSRLPRLSHVMNLLRSDGFSQQRKVLGPQKALKEIHSNRCFLRCSADHGARNLKHMASARFLWHSRACLNSSMRLGDFAWAGARREGSVGGSGDAQRWRSNSRARSWTARMMRMGVCGPIHKSEMRTEPGIERRTLMIDTATKSRSSMIPDTDTVP